MPEDSKDAGARTMLPVAASEAQLAQLVSLLPAGIFAIDGRGGITFFNPRAVEIWGIAPALGTPHSAFAGRFRFFSRDGRRLLPPEELPIAATLRTGQPSRPSELLVERPDGRRLELSFSVDATFDGAGQVNGAIAVFQDVTRRHSAPPTGLEETAERYRAVLQQASVAILECDLAGRIVQANVALQRLVGYTEDELRGMNWRSLVPADELGRDSTAAETLKQGQIESFSAERRILRKDGSSGWVDVFATMVRPAGAESAHGLAVMVDITARKRTEAQLRETESRFRMAADNAPVLIWTADAALGFTWVNQPWLEFVGCSLEHELGQGWLENVHPEDRERLRQSGGSACARHERFSADFRLRHQDGHYRWMLNQGVPRWEASEFVGYIGSCIDITDRRLAEQALVHARDEALAASRAKDDFLAALSHELRTPLSPVLLLASEAACDPRLPASVRADFETIRKSVELEARLIDDLLDLTRIVRNKVALDRRPVDVPVVLRDALVTVHADFKAKAIALILDLAPESQWVLGDPVRLQQVFWNVLKNAAKFTPDEGRVTISSRPEPARKTLVIEVSDTGIGLTPAEIDRVFEAFAQGEHAMHGGSHRFGGLGLGLAISRRVVELHHGRIMARSEGRNHGAVFRIELPLLDPAQVPVGPAIETRPRLPPASVAAPLDTPIGSVLLVEDHAPTRAALTALLTRRNYTVHSAANLAEARALAGRHRFDLLISDIGLPDGSGHELMQELRTREGLRGIALTGYGMDEDIARSQNAGFALHLTKPVRIQYLDRALEYLARTS